MNLYKFNFDLAGSANKINTITIPTDSKYSIGVKFFKGSEELILGDDVKITIQDDKYIYTPTEIFNNYAVFAGATGSNCKESKTYKVNFHKDGIPTKMVSYNEVVAPKTQIGNTSITLQMIIDAAGPNFEDFDYGQYRWIYEKKVDGKNYSDYDNANKCDVGGTGITSLSLKSEFFPTYVVPSSSQFMTYGSGDKQIYMWNINGKYGFIPRSVMVAKEGQPVSENDFLTGSISDWFGGNIPTTSKVIGRISFVLGETYANVRLYGKPVPEFNQSFNGINIKTNESKVSNWAITDSLMKIVYTDEWPELSATADDRVIYFVVDKPTPPQPVPPKPVPPTPGEMRFGIGFAALSESDEFDPNSVEDCLNKFIESSIKYTRDNDVYYLTITQSSTGNETLGEAEKVDLLGILLSLGEEDDGKWYLEANYTKVTNNGIIFGAFGKEVAGEDEGLELMELYFVDRYGEDGSLPNTSNPIPEDFNDWKIVFEETAPIEGIVMTSDYAYIPADEEQERPPIKFLFNSETFPQWTAAGPD